MQIISAICYRFMSPYLSGSITLGQVLTVNPFGNTIEMITLKGVHLREVMEHSVANYDPLDPSGRFLQVSGMQYGESLGLSPIQIILSSSWGTEFTYLAKNVTLALERYTAHFFVCIECLNYA